MVTEIYLVRHAHSHFTPDEKGRGLSIEGKKNVPQITRILVAAGVNVIISSPYKRAWETVAGAAEELGLVIEIDERFKERVVAASPVANFHGTIKRLWSQSDFSLPGGESNNVACRRGRAGIMEVLKKHAGRRIAIGTHGNIMTIIINSFNREYSYNFWRQLSIPDIYCLRFNRNNLLAIERTWPA